MSISLADLKIGESAVVDSLDGVASWSRRLQEMGVAPGESIEVLALAPLGDPIEIRIRGYRLSVRREHAKMIGVRRGDP